VNPSHQGGGGEKVIQGLEIFFSPERCLRVHQSINHVDKIRRLRGNASPPELTFSRQNDSVSILEVVKNSTYLFAGST
jgi:hypothetical protein